MKIAARRRLAVGVVATTSAMLAGVLIAPASTAAPNGVTITPNGVVNTNEAAVLTFNTTEADLTLGGTATFTRIGSSSTFEVDVDGGQDDPVPPDNEGTAVVDFTDHDNGLGKDGPIEAGSYSVSITGNEGPTGTVGGGTDTCVSCFTVLSPGPVDVRSVAPNSLRPGTQGNVSVLGNNFERSTRIDVLFADGSVDPTINPNNAPRADNSDTGAVDETGITTRTELLRRFIVGSGAQPGSRDLRVTNLDGSTAVCSACFFVAGAALTSSNPTAAFNDPGQALTQITFSGPNVTNGTPRLEFVGNPGANSRSQLSVIGQNIRNYTGTSITADFDLANAAPGSNAYQPFVQGSEGIVNACDTCRFTVIQRESRTPTLTSLDRSEDPGIQKNLRVGETATFSATGTNFSKGATLLFAPSTGLTVTAVEFVSPEQLLVTIAAGNDAGAGDKDVTARLTDGKTSPVCDNCLTVTPASSTASPSPAGTVSPSASASPSATPSASAAAGGDARYAGLQTPQRVLDTRSNRGARRSGEIVLDLSQRITDPNATAAVLNVTVTNATARGFLVAYPNGNTKPGTSNVNFEANQTQANEVVVALPADKQVSLFVDSASAHVIADLVGFFTTTSSTDTGRVTTNSPVRALDTRSTDQKRRRGEVILDLSSRLPQGASNAILNVTVTTPSARGFVTVFPTGTTRPGTSNVNFEANQTQANEVITRVGTGSNAGKVSLFVDSAEAALIVDVVGAVTPGTVSGSQVFTALDQPTRALDTRSNRGSRRSGNVEVTMPSTVPSNATGVILNVTATNGSRPGFVTVFPTGSTNPGTSNVNFPTSRTQANEVTTALGTNRRVTLFVGGANSPAVHLIVDVVGYLTTQGAAPAASGTASPTASPSCEPDPTPVIGNDCPQASASPTASPSASTTASPTASATVSPSATASPVSPTPTASATP
jgi:hypothetical protein